MSTAMSEPVFAPASSGTKLDTANVVIFSHCEQWKKLVPTRRDMEFTWSK